MNNLVSLQFHPSIPLSTDLSSLDILHSADSVYILTDKYEKTHNPLPNLLHSIYFLLDFLLCHLVVRPETTEAPLKVGILYPDCMPHRLQSPFSHQNHKFLHLLQILYSEIPAHNIPLLHARFVFCKFVYDKVFPHDFHEYTGNNLENPQVFFCSPDLCQLQNNSIRHLPIK